jgi:hypothetical protein
MHDKSDDEGSHNGRAVLASGFTLVMASPKKMTAAMQTTIQNGSV